MKKFYFLFIFFVLISTCCYSQQIDTSKYQINGKYYTQQELDSMQARLIELERTIGAQKYSIKSQEYKNPFQNAAKYLFNAGHLIIAGEITSIATVCVTGIGIASSVDYFYIATAGLSIASLVCFIVAGINIKNSSKEFQKISVENGKIVIKIE